MVPTDAWTRYYRAVKDVVALIDGKEYKTEAEAIAAIKEGSNVYILRDFESEALPLSVSCTIYNAKDYFKVPAIVSATHKVENLNGIIKTSPAAENEIFTITFADGNKTETRTAALGTLVAAPEVDGTPRFNEETKQYVVNRGWTLVEGEKVLIATASVDAIQLIETVDAIIVYWTDESGETILDTHYYCPGVATELDEFRGEDFGVDHTPDYYGIVRTDWTGMDDVDFETSGTYYVKAVMGKIAPDTFPGLQYNYTLFSNFMLNFYIPKDLDGATFESVSTVKDGSIKFEKTGEGTLKGISSLRYSYMFGAADTSVSSYYINYTLDDGTKLSFEVKYIGIPTYAHYILENYKSDDADKDELAKTLVVNMANYSDKVLTEIGKSKDTMGAAIYAQILENYGEKYLSRYNNLTDEKFLANGEIYEADGIAALNWVTKNDEANATALSYIDGISFQFDENEPMFMIKLSEEAVKAGLQKPSGSGATAAHTHGLHLSTGFTGNQCYTLMWAEDASGKAYYGSTNIWLDANGVNHGVTE
jgi:hypothetical protein